jgi:NTP pyrophosphatase (non-canonical NTP hydrolase)
MNHQALIERSHKQAVDKGFWEKPLTFDMAMALIISEIAEALEAYRKGRVNPDWNDIQAVKDSFEVEIADAIIRIYDWCGSKDYELESYTSTVNWSKDNEGYNFMFLFKSISDSIDREYFFEVILNHLFSYCVHHNINIERFIMWKLDYNLTRAYKHGKQF